MGNQNFSIFPTKYKLDFKKYGDELFTVIYPILIAVGITDKEKDLGLLSQLKRRITCYEKVFSSQT
jgi:hypothetical protein